MFHIDYYIINGDKINAKTNKKRPDGKITDKTEVTMDHENNTEKENNPGKVLFYKCSVCGVLHDGKEGAPKSCVKCDNDKFYKVYK